MDPAYEAAARHLLDRANLTAQFQTPKPTLTLVEWKRGVYFGSTQQPYEEYPEVVILNKTSKPLVEQLIEAIKKEDQKLPYLTADDVLDLTGRKHVLRRLESRLTIMTPEQTRYAIANPIRDLELSL